MLNQQTWVWFSESAHPCNLKEVVLRTQLVVASMAYFCERNVAFGSYCSIEQGHVVMRLLVSDKTCIITSCGIRVNVAKSPVDVQCRVNESGESGADHH